VVKLTDGRVVDQTYRRRVAVMSPLAETNDSAVGPLTTRASVIVELAGWVAVVYPLIAGTTPDVGEEAEVRRMATTLASLHDSLRRLDPVEFEVGNTLYMVRFDASMSPEMERYERFRAWSSTSTGPICVDRDPHCDTGLARLPPSLRSIADHSLIRRPHTSASRISRFSAIDPPQSGQRRAPGNHGTQPVSADSSLVRGRLCWAVVGALEPQAVVDWRSRCS
jgi:hypothetical protein